MIQLQLPQNLSEVFRRTSKLFQWRAFLLLYLLLSEVACYGQQRDFSIHVKESGSQHFKYVYFYSWIQNSMQRKELLPDGVEFTGKYDLITDGRYQKAIILISNLDLKETELLSQPLQFRRDFIVENKVDIVFNSDTKYFKVDGHSLNKIDNIFRDNEYKYSRRLDSLTADLKSLFPDSLLRAKEYKKIRRTVFFQEKESTLGLIRNNTGGGPIIENLMVYAMVPIRPVEEVREVFNRFPSAVRTARMGMLVDSLIGVQENMKKAGLKVGEQMPEFALKNSKDILVKSSANMDKYTLIDFWASWCAPCRAETPNLIKAYNSFHAKGFNIIAISIDQLQDKEKWLSAIDKDHADAWVNLFNPGGTDNIAKQLGINAIPANYLIDNKGKVIAKDLRGGALREMLEKLMK
jgi:thiol-disulfide isomerase/thioredoxin